MREPALTQVKRQLDDSLLPAFIEILKFIPNDAPIICESPALRNFIEPGTFIIMTSDVIIKHKNISHLQKLPNITLKLEDLVRNCHVPVGFEDGKWL